MKKPLPIIRVSHNPIQGEAMVWTGDNFDDIHNWLGIDGLWCIDRPDAQLVISQIGEPLYVNPGDVILKMPTPTGATEISRIAGTSFHHFYTVLKE